MGGKVFDNYEMPDGSPPQVPRMSPELYQELIAEYQPRLEALFRNVIVPRDAPNKEDHGDIDFLVEGIRLSARDQELWKLTEGCLGAELRVARNQSQSFGIPHPNVAGAFVQVDVELSPGNGTLGAADLFEWTKFMKGDADLLQIIGIAHRPLGLTCNDRGLHVRLEQIEPYDKKKALLFLTRDPDAAMRFYGFAIEKHAAGFSSETELFDWVASGRFFSRTVFEQRIEKADDRSRQSKRPMYRRFVEEYMPNTNTDTSKPWSRDQVLREAIRTFDVEQEYAAMIASHEAKTAEEDLWIEIRASIPAKDKALAGAVRALRRWIVFDDGKPRIAEKPFAPEEYLVWSRCVGASDKKDVLAWVGLHWREVKSRDRVYQNGTSGAVRS